MQKLVRTTKKQLLETLEELELITDLAFNLDKNKKMIIERIKHKITEYEHKD